MCVELITTKRDEKAFFFALKKMAKEIKKRDDFVVVFHHDADGCASGAIAIKSLQREGKKVTSKCLKQLYREDVPQIKSLGKNFLFVDFGSGQLDFLVEEFGENLFVLDHHQPLNFSGKEINHEWHVNPLLYGINGGTEISGAGVAFFFSLALSKKNSDLSPLAIVGALGDMQDFNDNHSLIGLNRKIIEIAKKQNLIEVRNDLRLYGRISRPLVSFLAFSSNPILPNLTANEDNCKTFLTQIELPLKDPFTEQWLSYEDLNLEQKKKLTSSLIINLIENNVPEWKVKELIGEVYTLLKEAQKSPLRDGKEFATLLNACGRNKNPEIALAVCLGDRKTLYEKALSLMESHKENLRKGIEFVKQKGIEEKKQFYFFDAKESIDESIIGIIAGMLYGTVLLETKPIIAIAHNPDGTIKASARGTAELVRKGLKLGQTLKELSREINGVEGGGHKIAAGAKIPKEKADEFINALEKKLKSN